MLSLLQPSRGYAFSQWVFRRKCNCGCFYNRKRYAEAGIPCSSFDHCDVNTWTRLWLSHVYLRNRAKKTKASFSHGTVDRLAAHQYGLRALLIEKANTRPSKIRI